MVKCDPQYLQNEEQGRINCIKPEWLDALLSQKFFTPCDLHSSVKKNDKNIYCVDCSVSICHHCSRHRLHSLLQIRRYVYHDVVRLQDIAKLIDCAHVQPYVINSAKVVFLNRRQSAAKANNVNVCRWCKRTLQDAYKYCCVACKVDAVVHKGSDREMRSLIRRTSSTTYSENYTETTSDSLNSRRIPKSTVISGVIPSRSRLIERRLSGRGSTSSSPADSVQTSVTAKSAGISVNLDLSVVAGLQGNQVEEEDHEEEELEEEEEQQLSSPNCVLIDVDDCGGNNKSADCNYNCSDLISTSTSTTTTSSMKGVDQQEQKTAAVIISASNNYKEISCYNYPARSAAALLIKSGDQLNLSDSNCENSLINLQRNNCKFYRSSSSSTTVCIDSDSCWGGSANVSDSRFRQNVVELQVNTVIQSKNAAAAAMCSSRRKRSTPRRSPIF